MLRQLRERLTQGLSPDPEALRAHPSLRLFQRWLYDPNLWDLNRYSVSTAVFIGFFVAFTPLPIHMAAAALLAIWWRANLPVAVAAVWLSNPLTLTPQFYLAYKVGAHLLHLPQSDFAFELSMRWVREEFAALWQPLLLGCLVCGSITATVGWIAVRVLWRAQVIARWRARRHQREHRD